VNIDDYVTNINKNINRIKESDSADIIDITIKNYAIYNTFFVELQDKLSKDGNKLNYKLNALNFMVMHSTFMFNGFINDLITNNYYSLKINIRVIIEYYFKLLFLLYSDDYVSQLYLDFDDVYLYNLSRKNNYNLKMRTEENEKLEILYNDIVRKYKLPENIKEDYWIKLALEHNTGKTSKKSIQKIIEWLKDLKVIDDAIIVAYEFNCDFNHCGIGSLNYQQMIDLYDSENKFYDIYHPILVEFNYVLINIITRYTEVYPEYKNQEVIDKLEKNMNLIIKKGK